MAESKPNYICDFCKKPFSRKDNCVRHTKTCKSKIKLDREKEKEEEIRQKDELIKKLENEKKEKDEQIEFLKSLLASYSNKPIINNTTINNNNITIRDMVVKLDPIDYKDVANYIDNFTSKYIDEGLKGFTKFLCEHPYKDKLITTDHSRNTIAYRTKDINFIRDPDGYYLLKRTLKENKEDIIDKAKVRLNTINNKIKEDDRYISIKRDTNGLIVAAENTLAIDGINKDVSDVLKYHGLDVNNKLLENT